MAAAAATDGSNGCGLVVHCEQRLDRKVHMVTAEEQAERTQEGGHMTEREKLEREIHQLAQIIAADAYALTSKSTPIADRAGLRKQLDMRTTMYTGSSLKQLRPRLRPTAVARLRGPRAQAKHNHEAKLTKGVLPPTRSALLARIKAIKQAHAKSKRSLAFTRPEPGPISRRRKSQDTFDFSAPRASNLAADRLTVRPAFQCEVTGSFDKIDHLRGSMGRQRVMR